MKCLNDNNNNDDDDRNELNAIMSLLMGHDYDTVIFEKIREKMRLPSAQSNE